MKAELHTFPVADVIEGFVYNELEGKGLYGLAGELVISATTSTTMASATSRSSNPSSRATRWV